jgi:hypothetical protein
VKNILKYAGRAAAGALPAALVAEVGMPALGAVVFLAILVVRVICWIIGSGDRSERVTRMILARTGAPRCPPPPRLCPRPVRGLRVAFPGRADERGRALRGPGYARARLEGSPRNVGEERQLLGRT